MSGINNFSSESIKRFAKNGYIMSSDHTLIREDLQDTKTFTWIYLVNQVCNDFYTPYICEILFNINTIYGLVNHYEFVSSIQFDSDYKKLYYNIEFANLLIRFVIRTTINNSVNTEDKTLTEIKLVEPMTIIDKNNDIEIKIRFSELYYVINKMIDVNAPTKISKKLLASLIFVD